MRLFHGMRTTALALTALALTTACTDTASRARADSLAAALATATAARDSLQGLVQGSSADKDRAMAQVVEASKFADEIDAELRKVKGLSSKVSVNKSDESGKTEAAAAQKDILDRLAQLRQRLAARQKQVAALLDTLKTMRADSTATATLLADLNARLSQRDKEIAAFQDEIRQLRSANETLVAEKAVLNDTVKAMDVRENKVFYIVGSRRQLLADGVVAEEGGSRGLLIVKLGKTLVPARSIPEAKFTGADRRQTLTIPLPKGDRAYKIVSRHDVGLIEVAKKEKDGSFRGESIRITDPAKFWAPSRYLIIAEK
ncbi:MAG: ELKS/Rab6-interacting/CAST family protein [Gemmatimonadaceae bacterium]|nr:ELKS/Rab6-interacting/CAST family protein [Gemmatimonadaceae bacterium]